MWLMKYRKWSIISDFIQIVLSNYYYCVLIRWIVGGKKIKTDKILSYFIVLSFTVNWDESFQFIEVTFTTIPLFHMVFVAALHQRSPVHCESDVSPNVARFRNRHTHTHVLTHCVCVCVSTCWGASGLWHDHTWRKEFWEFRVNGLRRHKPTNQHAWQKNRSTQACTAAQVVILQYKPSRRVIDISLTVRKFKMLMTSPSHEAFRDTF